MPCLKKDAPPELVEAVRQIEERADRCFEPLRLLTLPWNVAAWSMLVGGVNLVEQEIARRGDNTPDLDATLINVSRLIPIAVKWAVEHGRDASKLASKRWTASLATTVDEASAVAREYDSFLGCLPLWHKDRYAAELIAPTLVRFTAPGSTRNRQVSAYQKGLRPKAGIHKMERPKKPDQTPRVQELFAQVLRPARKTGLLRFEYNTAWQLWNELLPEYQARMNGIVRRADSLSLGNYTMSDFKRFYAALLAVCAAHEFLCFAWGRDNGTYPCDSAVMIHSRSRWMALLEELSGISPEQCDAIVGDLTLDTSRPMGSVDLHVYPFVPLDVWMTTLALAPQFPLHSRPDENILRVCSIRRPDVFDVTTLEKESEMLFALANRGSHYSLQGPIALPKPTPDIDLIVTDDDSSTIVITELKWVRKNTRSVELIARDAEVLKGIRQLGRIRQFLNDKPTHLYSLGKLPKQLNEFANIYYMLVARDHWTWVEPAKDTAVVEFEAFAAALDRLGSLDSAMRGLLKYDWLPMEGRDFTVRYERATANGVSIESEVFYAT